MMTIDMMLNANRIKYAFKQNAPSILHLSLTYIQCFLVVQLRYTYHPNHPPAIPKKMMIRFELSPSYKSNHSRIPYVTKPVNIPNNNRIK